LLSRHEVIFRRILNRLFVSAVSHPIRIITPPKLQSRLFRNRPSHRRTFPRTALGPYHLITSDTQNQSPSKKHRSQLFSSPQSIARYSNASIPNPRRLILPQRPRNTQNASTPATRPGPRTSQTLPHQQLLKVALC